MRRFIVFYERADASGKGHLEAGAGRAGPPPQEVRRQSPRKVRFDQGVGEYLSRLEPACGWIASLAVNPPCSGFGATLSSLVSGVCCNIPL